MKETEKNIYVRPTIDIITGIEPSLNVLLNSADDDPGHDTIVPTIDW